VNETLVFCVCVFFIILLVLFLIFLVSLVGLVFYFLKKHKSDNQTSSAFPPAGTISSTHGSDYCGINVEEEQRRMREELILSQHRKTSGPSNRVKITSVEPMPSPAIQTSWESGTRIGNVEEENNQTEEKE